MLNESFIRAVRPIAVALAFTMPVAACTKSPETVEASAAQHLAVNESRSAMVELKDLLQREPNRPKARLLLGRALNDQDDYAGAENELRRAAGLGVGAEELARPLARAMLYQGRFAEIIKEPLFESIKTPLSRADVLDRKASALLALGRSDDAMAAIQEARKLVPDFGAASATLANLLLDQKREDEAKAILAEALRADPKSAEVHRSYGMYLLRTQRPADAVAYFAKAADLALGPPRDRQIQRTSLAALVDTELSQQRAVPAEAALARLDGLGQGRINGLLRARLYMLKGDLPEARRGLEVLTSGGRDDPDATLLLGIVNLMQGNMGQAEMHLNAVLAAVPNHFVARQVLAQLRMQAGKPKEAVTMLEPLLKEASGNVVTLAVQANLAAGDRPAALAMLERSATAAGNDSRSSTEIARGFLLANEPGRALETLPATGTAGIADIATVEGLRLAALLAKNDIASARRVADELAQRETKNAAVQTLLGDFYARVGAVDRARTALQLAAMLAPSDAGVVLRLAQLDALGGDVKSAESRLVAAIKTNPKSAMLHSALAELQAARGDSTDALEALRKAQELAPENNQLRLREAQVRLAKGDTQGAQKTMEEAAKRAPTDKNVIRARIATLLAAKNNDQAIAVARDAVKAQPKDVELAVTLAGTQAAAGQLDAAIGTAQDTVRANPASIPALSALADLQLRKGDLVAARRTGADLAAVDPNHPAVALIEAEAALKERKFAVAADALASANSRVNNAALAVREFAVRREGKLPEPEAPLARWLVRNPDDAQVTLALAEYRLGQRETQAALDLYRRVLNRQPRNPIALNNAAWAEATLGNTKVAVELAERAYNAAPRAAAVADTYGWVLSKAGDHTRALEVLGKARQGPGSIPDVDYHYAAALLGLGRRDEAKVVLDQVLAKNPSFQSRDEAAALRASLN